MFGIGAFNQSVIWWIAHEQRCSGQRNHEDKTGDCATIYDGFRSSANYERQQNR